VNKAKKAGEGVTGQVEKVGDKMDKAMTGDEKLEKPVN